MIEHIVKNGGNSKAKYLNETPLDQVGK